MSIAKKIAVTIMSVVALSGLVGCSAQEQYHFFVELGDRVGLIQDDPTLEDIAWHIEDAKAEWTPETATPAQNAVLTELARQAEARRAEETRRAQIQGHPFLVCVRNHESATAGLYAAENPSSSASGAYQFLDSTWRVVSSQAGYPGYARAIHAPWWVQDAVAYDLAIERGQRFHWNGTGC